MYHTAAAVTTPGTLRLLLARDYSWPVTPGTVSVMAELGRPKLHNTVSFRYQFKQHEEYQRCR